MFVDKFQSTCNKRAWNGRIVIKQRPKFWHKRKTFLIHDTKERLSSSENFFSILDTELAIELTMDSFSISACELDWDSSSKSDSWNDAAKWKLFIKYMKIWIISNKDEERIECEKLLPPMSVSWGNVETKIFSKRERKEKGRSCCVGENRNT